MGRQNAHFDKQKHEKNKKHAFRPSRQQQHEATALRLSEATPTDEFGLHTSEGRYKNLDDGRYEKTIYVKTWTGRTVSLETDLIRAVETVKRQLEAKIGIPKDHQHLVSRGKVLTADRTLKNSFISGGETIELTALLLGGTKHKSLSPTPMDADREKKRK